MNESYIPMAEVPQCLLMTHSTRTYYSLYFKGKQLVVESTKNNGTKVLEYYSLSADAKQLQLKLSIQPLQFPKPLIIKRVYEINKAIIAAST